jgi:hypothetical protein
MTTSDDFYTKHLPKKEPLIKCEGGCSVKWNEIYLKVIEDKKLCPDCYDFWKDKTPLPKILG